MWKKYKPYIFEILIALAVGGLSALLSMNGMKTFSEVAQPALSPPMWLFPIVWSILYILMGISAGLAIKTGSRVPFSYRLSLAINFFWSIIFFNMRAYLFAFIWLILLWVVIIIMISDYYKINKTAAYLQIPYLLWVTFAAYLTFAIWLLN